jgi:hypothetical protein
MVTWTINRAFLQELKDVNPDYWTTFSQLERWLDSLSADPLKKATAQPEMVSLIRRLRDELSRQFRLEETYGYMQTPIIHSQTYAALVESVYNQHKSLYLLASEICEAAERAEYQGMLAEAYPQLIVELGRLYQLWNEHEQAERKLIYESK